jgi:hypothetical protein
VGQIGSERFSHRDLVSRALVPSVPKSFFLSKFQDLVSPNAPRNLYHVAVLSPRCRVIVGLGLRDARAGAALLKLVGFTCFSWLISAHPDHKNLQLLESSSAPASNLDLPASHAAIRRYCLGFCCAVKFMFLEITGGVSTLLVDLLFTSQTRCTSDVFPLRAIYSGHPGL